jgi:hypothetical protein
MTYVARWIYGNKTVDLALAQGWTEEEAVRHGKALADEAVSGGAPEATDRVSLTHPFNYLTEEQVEEWEREMMDGSKSKSS